MATSIEPFLFLDCDFLSLFVESLFLILTTFFEALTIMVVNSLTNESISCGDLNILFISFEILLQTRFSRRVFFKTSLQTNDAGSGDNCKVSSVSSSACGSTFNAKDREQ